MMDASSERKWGWALALALTALFVFVGIYNAFITLDSGGSVQTFGRFWSGMLGGFIPAALVLGATFLGRRAPLTGLAVGLALTFLLTALQGTVVITHMGWWREEGAIVLVPLGILGALLFLGSLAVSRRVPRLGAALALGGIPMVVIMWWTIVAPLLALGLVAFGFQRAQRFAEEQAERRS